VRVRGFGGCSVGANSLACPSKDGQGKTKKEKEK